MRDKHTARRNMIAGVLAGLVIATVFGAYATTTFKKMVAGKPATAADVNAAHQDLATAIDKLQAELATLKAEQACPPGYTRDKTATTITLCKKGSDEMVKVGDYWIDRYEASLVNGTTWAAGKCNGTGGKQYGAGITDDLPATFPDNGNWLIGLYACAIKGQTPSRMMTWFQAQQACLLAGKRLCTNGQWQGAAADTPDDSTSCNTGSSGVEVAGNRAACRSKWGARDMVGNLYEWVDWWTQAGKSWMTTDGQKATAWPSGYGSDATWNLNGRARHVASGYKWSNGIPAAALRGGHYSISASAGVFAIHLVDAPTKWGAAFGFRCCRGGS